MAGELIAVEDFLEELAAMLTVCFEGKAELCGDSVSLEFPNGQKFSIKCREA